MSLIPAIYVCRRGGAGKCALFARSVSPVHNIWLPCARASKKSILKKMWMYQTNIFRYTLKIDLGSCAYVSIWVVVMDPILCSTANKDICFNITSPIGNQINPIEDAYVDDTALVCPDTSDP